MRFDRKCFMRKIFIILLLIFGIVMCGFSKQYVKMYWYDYSASIEGQYSLNENRAWKEYIINFVKDLNIETVRGARVIQITPVIKKWGYGSTTVGFIVVFDDEK